MPERDSVVPARPSARVLPSPTFESRPFWSGGEHGQLLIMRCGSCRRWFHPPSAACFRCRSTDVAAEPVSGRATVATFSVNVQQWEAGFPPPYVVAIVELEEDPSVRLTTNIVECAIGDVHIGLRVEVLFEHFDDVWIPVFRPIAGGVA